MKLCKIAVMLCVFTGASFAQVQLGRNVQIGAGAGTTVELQTNGIDNLSQTLLDLVQGTNITVTNTSGGHVRISAGAGLETQVIPPIGGQYVVVYPTVGVIDTDPVGNGVIGPTGGKFQWQCSGILCNIAPAMAAHWTGFTLPSYVNPANVTAVYADGMNSASELLGFMPGGGSNTSQLWCSGMTGTNTLFPSFGTPSVPWSLFEGTRATTLTGAQVATARCDIHLGVSALNNSGFIVNVPAIRLIVYYTGTAPPVRTAIDVAPPLAYNPATLTLSDEALTNLINGGSDQNVLTLLSSNTTAASLTINDTSVAGGGYQLSVGGSSNTYPGAFDIYNNATLHQPLTIKANDDVILSSLSASTSPICPNGTGGALTTVGCAGGGGTPGGSTTQIQYNNAGSFGGDSGFTTDGAGHETMKTLNVADGTGQGGTVDLTEGTGATAAASHDVLYADSTAHCIKYSTNGGSFACLGTGGGNTTSTSLTTNSLPKANGANSIINSLFTDDGTTGTYTGTGGFSAKSANITGSGSGAGWAGFTAGTAPSLVSGAVVQAGPTSTTGYVLHYPSALPTTNQVQQCTATSTDVACTWTSLFSAPVTTKGDLFTFSTVNARLPVGTDGQVLSADSTQTTGLKWIAAGGTGTVTSIATTGPITGGTITTTGTIACATCVTSAASLTSNAVMIGGGSQASSTISADTTTTHALFATATAPAFRAIAAGDIPASLSSTTSVNGTTIPASVTLTQTIASGTSALGTSAISSGACATVVTTTATGTATTDVVPWGFNADPTSTTGYSPTSTGMLTIIAYPTANNVNFKVCNNTSASITPGAVTLNWRIVR